MIHGLAKSKLKKKIFS